MTDPVRARIRRDIREQRRQLSPAERGRRSEAVCSHVARVVLRLRARRIACFYPNDGEVDLSPLFARLWQTGRRLYLPVLAGKRLRFLPYTADSTLAENRFGIPEPHGRRVAHCPPLALDIVLVPLVAYDAEGNRIGMGGGYYDRTFAYLRQRRRLRRPRLIGTAFAFQRRDALGARPWDIPLNAAVTENGFETMRRPRGTRSAPQSPSEATSVASEGARS